MIFASPNSTLDVGHLSAYTPNIMSRRTLDTDQLKEIANSCAWTQVRRVSRFVTKMYDDAVRPSGLRASQVSLLVMISRMQPVVVSALADRAGMDRTTLSRNLVPLERRGLIVTATGEDRRSREVRLTSSGEGALVDVYPLWRAAQEELSELLGEYHVSRLLSDLRLVVEKSEGH